MDSNISSANEEFQCLVTSDKGPVKTNILLLRGLFGPFS